jgi:uncharacterized membrane protein
MTDFNIWLVGSICLVILGCFYTVRKGSFAVEIFNFVAFVCAIGYIILRRYTYGSWVLIPLIWLAGIVVSAVLLLLYQSRNIPQGKREVHTKNH